MTGHGWFPAAAAVSIHHLSLTRSIRTHILSFSFSTRRQSPIFCSWDDVTHINPRENVQAVPATKKFERDARTLVKGSFKLHRCYNVNANTGSRLINLLQTCWYISLHKKNEKFTQTHRRNKVFFTLRRHTWPVLTHRQKGTLKLNTRRRMFALLSGALFRIWITIEIHTRDWNAQFLTIKVEK